MEKKSKLHPLFWSGLILIASQTLTLHVALQVKHFAEANQITPPQISLGLPLVYFFGVVVLLGVILLLVPIDKLRLALRIMFTFLFAWGMFVMLGLSLPMVAACFVAVTGSLIWFFRPRVWLHNLLMIITLAGVGAVFGFLLSPWTVISFLLIISIYDVLAVRFGYMLWMVKKLFETGVLPALVIPTTISVWNLDLNHASVKRLLENRTAEREFSILGGGDIGFPLLLVVSVFFVYGFISSVIVAAFSLVGLISAYLIQILLFKGKPMPALPPITFVCLTGFLIVYLI